MFVSSFLGLFPNHPLIVVIHYSQIMTASDDEDGVLGQLPTTISRSPGTPSTLGSHISDNTSTTSPTRAAARARALAAAALSPTRAAASARTLADADVQGGGDDDQDSTRSGDDDAAEVEVVEVDEVLVDDTATADSGKPNKRAYDYSKRDQVRAYFSIVDKDEGGSFDNGGTFLCVFCKRKKFMWTTKFNVSVARQHLVNACDSCPDDVQEWILESSSICQMKNVKKRRGATPVAGLPPVPPRQRTGSAMSVASTQGGGMWNFVKPNFQKSVLSGDKGNEIITAYIEMFLSFFDSPVRVISSQCAHALQTACGSGIMKFIPTENKVWDIVKMIDKESHGFMEERLKMEPGNLTIGFDGVTALGKHATLYTLSKGFISLFLTIR